MYEATQDQDILDQFITWADHILAGRNDKATKLIVWTGNIEPNWPTGVSQHRPARLVPRRKLRRLQRLQVEWPRFNGSMRTPWS